MKYDIDFCFLKKIPQNKFPRRVIYSVRNKWREGPEKLIQFANSNLIFLTAAS